MVFLLFGVSQDEINMTDWQNDYHTENKSFRYLRNVECQDNNNNNNINNNKKKQLQKQQKKEIKKCN